MKEDNEGFQSPHLDASLCVDCSLCVRSCPALNAREASLPLKVFAAKNTDYQERMDSSSGGLFLPVARDFISHGGIVFGAAFADNFTKCIHREADNMRDARLFSGSKYLQSETAGTYTRVKELLQHGRKVLYTGTPCQIAGLKAFLGKEHDGLYCMDLVCHSVPSPGVWRKYLSELKLPNVASVRFRDKVTGWKLFSITLSDRQGNILFTQREDQNPYMNGFLKDMYCRRSCHNCFARSGRSGSDITIADFWKLKKFHHKFDDDSGVGLALVRTMKGMELFNSGNFKFIECSYKEALYGNPALERDSAPHPKREDFFKRYSRGKKIIPFIRKNTSPSVSYRMKIWLKKMFNSKCVR